MRRMLMGTLAALALAPAGCGKPAGSSASGPAQSQTAAPTTQVTLDEPRKSIPLLIMPLTLSVPQDWRVYPPVRPAFLTGPAPDGSLQISISMLDFMDSQRMNAFISGQEDLSQEHPQRKQVRQLTVKSGLHAMETLTYANAGGSPASRPSTQPDQILSWSLVVFVPYQQRFIPCSFDLLGLTQQQFTDDEPLIHSIIDTAESNDVPSFQ